MTKVTREPRGLPADEQRGARWAAKRWVERKGSPLKPVEWLVLWHLAKCWYFETERTYPISLEQLCTRVNTSLSSVRRARTNLHDYGLIEWTTPTKDGRNCPCIYTLNLDCDACESGERDDSQPNESGGVTVNTGEGEANESGGVTVNTRTEPVFKTQVHQCSKQTFTSVHSEHTLTPSSEHLLQNTLRDALPLAALDDESSILDSSEETTEQPDNAERDAMAKAFAELHAMLPMSKPKEAKR